MAQARAWQWQATLERSERGKVERERSKQSKAQTKKKHKRNCVIITHVISFSFLFATPSPTRHTPLLPSCRIFHFPFRISHFAQQPEPASRATDKYNFNASA